MSEKSPGKIIELDQIIINRSLEELCKCNRRKFTLDTQNKRVMCASCGSIVDPYDAMYEMAFRWEQINEQIEFMRKQREQIISYKPCLLTIRELEKKYRGKTMLPKDGGKDKPNELV